jgi:hypothetical protein
MVLVHRGGGLYSVLKHAHSASSATLVLVGVSLGKSRVAKGGSSHAYSFFLV